MTDAEQIFQAIRMLPVGERLAAFLVFGDEARTQSTHIDLLLQRLADELAALTITGADDDGECVFFGHEDVKRFE